MKIIGVEQGSDAWRAVRAAHHTASEAPAMMGASRYQSRGELLRQKATGIARGIDARAQALFDRGHAAEAAARPIVEEMIADELYPVTVSDDDGWLLASLDGMTMDGRAIFEHKLFNESLAEQVRACELEPHYWAQLEQQLLVSGAEGVIFVCSDGTKDRFVSMEYRAVPGRAEQLIAGWKQFDIDLAAYVPTAPAPVAVAVAAPMESLPAVSVRLDGALAVASNLPEFSTALRLFVTRIPEQPATDDEFATTEAACKALRRAEDALLSAEDQALSQIPEVDRMRRAIKDLRELARSTRLARDKLVAARKEQIRCEIVREGHAKLARHIESLNKTIGAQLMPAVPLDFAGAIRNKRTIDSSREAVDSALTRAKIAANEVAALITINPSTMRECEHRALLLPDWSRLAVKNPDDLKASIGERVAERRRMDAGREPIRAAAIDDGERMNLTTLNARLAPVVITVSGLASLGFEPVAKVKTSSLYRASDFPAICAALVGHIQSLRKEAATC